MTDPRFQPIPKEPEVEPFTFTYVNEREEEQTLIAYLEIHEAERLIDREIYANVKMPFLITLDPKCDVMYQLANALYCDGIRGELKSVTYIINGEQVTI